MSRFDAVMNHLDTVTTRVGGRWFARRDRVEALSAEVAELSDANHHRVGEISDLETETGSLRARVAELESLSSDLTEQVRRAIEDLVGRAAGPPDEPR